MNDIPQSRRNFLRSAAAFVPLALGSKVSFASDDKSVQAALAKFTAAMGGIDRLRKIHTISMKGKIGTAGTFEIIQDWTHHREREILDLAAGKQTLKFDDGFNGSETWSSGLNGQVIINKDQASIAESETSTRFDCFDYLIHPDEYRFQMTEKPTSFVITVTDLRNAKAAFGKTIIEVGKQNYRPTKITTFEGGGTQVVTNESFLTHDGVLFAKQFTEKDSDGSTWPHTVVSITNVSGEAEFTPPALPHDFEFTNGTEGHADIKIINGFIFTTVMMRNAPYSFVVDTGAQESMLDSAVVKKLGLTSSGGLSANGVSGMQSAGFVKVPEMRVGDVILHNKNIGAIDLSFLDTKLPHVDGILGMDFFDRFVVRLDYVGGTMRMFDPATFKYSGTGERFPLSGTSFTLTVDGITGSFTIDTGAGSIDLFASHFGKTLLMKNESRMPSVAFVAGIGASALPISLARCHAISAGKYSLRDVPVEFTEAKQGAFANTDAAGNIGYPFWHRFTTYFNFSQGQMILEPNAEYRKPFALVDRAGLVLSKVNAQWVVDAIATKSPAAALGFEKGDILLSINGTALAGMPMEDVPKLFRQSAGTVLNITYRRDAAIKTARLALQDYVKYYDAY